MKGIYHPISFEEGKVREMCVFDEGVRDGEDGMVRGGGRDGEEVMA